MPASATPAPLTTATSPGTEEEIRRLRRLAAIILFIMVGVIGTWSVLANLSGAVVAMGVIKVEESPKLVQHASGGIIRRILVREGQAVSAGEPLFELEDVEASASMAIIRDQLASEMARLARLQAESAEAEAIRFPPELVARSSEPHIDILLQRERTLFQARDKLFRDQLRGLKEQQQELKAEIASLRGRIEAAEQSLSYLREQEKMLEALQTQGFVSQARMLEIRRAISEKLENKLEYETLKAQAGQKLVDLETRLGQIRENRLSENAQDMVEAQTRITDLRERLKPLEDALQRRLIKSPASGIINSIRVHTEGGVVGPGQTILEITPEESELIAVLRINPADIDELHPGQFAEVEFSGMNRRVTPPVPGRVIFISSDLNQDPANANLHFFIARIALTPDRPLGFQVKPGMPVTAYVETQARTPLEMWLDPLLGGLRKSMRES